MSFIDLGGVYLYGGDCLDVLKTYSDNSIDAVVTDPPYHLTSVVKRFGSANAAPAQHGTDGAFKRASRGFMGKEWDGGDIAFQPALWAKVLRVLKPGGYVVAFSGTRTYHRMACAIEDAGFDIRDQLGWVYGSGFPKSLDISKAIDKAAGATREIISEGAPVKRMIPGADQVEAGWEKTNGRVFVPTKTAASVAARQWDGWGTALKPAWEPICLARKPLEGTNVENILRHGVGGLNIDGCRVDIVGDRRSPCGADGNVHRTTGEVYGKHAPSEGFDLAQGRFPANILHDGSDEVLACFPQTSTSSGGRAPNKSMTSFGFAESTGEPCGYGDKGSAARFFYCAKANKIDRADSKHPTVKPISLMRWLCRLVTPPGGVVLDPFAGSGTTGQAAREEGFRAVLIERETEYQADIQRRLSAPVEVAAE